MKDDGVRWIVYAQNILSIVPDAGCMSHVVRVGFELVLALINHAAEAASILARCYTDCDL